MENIGLSIVVPAYNEEQGVLAVINELLQHSRNLKVPYEIIVVEDGSVDKTLDIISKIDGIKVLKHQKNKGYGASLKTGIRESKFPLICITDADGTYPNDLIPAFTEIVIKEDLDMVVGARSPKDSVWLRRPAKLFIKKLAEYTTGEQIPDFNSGLRIFKKRSVEKFFFLLPDGFSFTTTITLCMLNDNCRVMFEPIEYYPRLGESKISPIRDTKNFIILVLRISLYFQPLKVFLPISFLLLLSSIAWGLYSYIVFGKLADVSTLILFLSALQIGMTALLADLIVRLVHNFSADVSSAHR